MQADLAAAEAAEKAKEEKKAADKVRTLSVRVSPLQCPRSAPIPSLWLMSRVDPLPVPVSPLFAQWAWFPPLSEGRGALIEWPRELGTCAVMMLVLFFVIY